MNLASTHGFACFSSLAALSLAATACNPGDLLGNGGDSGSATYTPDFSQAPPAHSAALPCGDRDPDHLCIALKYVPYKDASGSPIVTEGEAQANLATINSTWSQCNIKFTIENFAPVDPASENLPYSDAAMDDLQNARDALSDGSTMLVVTTGQWTGELASQPANAWTNLPPVGPFGVVMERSVATYPNVIAHELGHYMNLVHVSDSYNVMNPVVYENSLNLTSDQCSMAHATAISFWGAMLR